MITGHRRARRPVLRRARRPRRPPVDLPDVLPGRARRAAIVTQADIGFAVDPGIEHEVFTIGDGEARQDAGHRRGAVPGVGAMGPHAGRRRRRRRRRRGHRRRRVRGGRVPPRRRRRARADDAARHGRRRHRRQDGREPAGGQEPRRRVLAAGRRAVRHRRARHLAAARAPQRAGRDGQVPLPHRRGPHGVEPRRARRGVRAHQGRRRRRRARRASGAEGAGARLNYGHTLGPRARDRRAVRPAPR